MYRHELRFVLRFGATREFCELADELQREELARGWTPPRIWRAVSGPVNQIVIEHDYDDSEALRNERSELHGRPSRVSDVLARIADLAVPGTAVQFELDGVVPATTT